MKRFPNRANCYYYFLKYYEEENDYFVKKLIYLFERNISVEHFLEFLIEQRRCTRYFYESFLNNYPRSLTFKNLKNFIKETDNLDNNSLYDIMLFYISYFLSCEFRVNDSNEDLSSEYMEFLTSYETIESNYRKFLLYHKEGKKLIDIKDTSTFISIMCQTATLDENRLNYFVNSYVLCINEPCEDEVYYSTNNKVLYSIDNMEKIEDLLDKIDALATDELLEESINELRKLLFTK